MTIAQKKRRSKKEIQKRKEKKRTRIALIKPQIKGIVIKVLTMKPKKPNSAIRKIVQCKINISSLYTKTRGQTNKKNIYKIIKAYIPGEGHNITQHSQILIRKGKTQDLPGVKFKVIRGVYDVKGVINRKKSRSKYGTKK